MTTPAAFAGMMHAAEAPQRRAGRWQPMLLLMALVLGLHLSLIHISEPTRLM
jgi:hypothetical protein